MTPLRIVLISGLTSLIVAFITFSGLRIQSSTSNAQPLKPVINGLSQEKENNVISVVEGTEPAVVSVIISKDVPILEQFEETIPSPFGFEFRVPRVRQNGTQLQQVGGGTAFFVSSDGLLMSNKHVISDPEAEYTVFLNDGREVKATVVARDPTNDIGLLKVQGNDFPFLAISNDDKLSLGQTAIAIGNALGEFRNTVSVGVISGLQRSIIAGSRASGETEALSDIIQTDAAINEGNSGGPLLNSDGEVIGMNTAVAAGGQNIGFAIPANDLRRALESYKKFGRIVKPFIGVRYSLITLAIKEASNLSYDYGALILPGTPEEPAIIPDSPAAKAGLQTGDIILEANGEKITTENPLASIIQRKMPGEKVELKVSRGGSERTVTLTLDEWKE